MSSKVLALFHLGNVGYMAKLEVTVGDYPAPEITVHEKFAESISFARAWVRKTLGLESPDLPFTWTLDPAYQDIDGYSLFGAFASALLQEHARLRVERADLMRGGSHVSLTKIRATSLSCVAISAGMDTDDLEGGFKTVGKIDEKLIRLTSSDLKGSACVLAWGQARPVGWPVEQWNGTRWARAAGTPPAQLYEKWHVPNARTPLPIIRAHDAIDAILRVFDMQCNSAGSKLLPI